MSCDDKLICTIEYDDPGSTTFLCDVWLTCNNRTIAAWRNVMVDVKQVGVEIFRQRPSGLLSLAGLGKPDEVISTIYRNEVDQIVDKRNIEI